jgi:hypothetical protein
MACLVASPRGKGNLRHGDVTRALGLSFSKRCKTIGALFIDVFEAEATKIGGAQFLAQGTLHRDVIETVSLTGGRPGRLHPVRPRQTRSSRFSTPVGRGIAAIAGRSSLRSPMKVR